MAYYREVHVVDQITNILDLIDVCVIASENLADKEKMVCILNCFLRPALEDIMKYLEIKAHDDD